MSTVLRVSALEKTFRIGFFRKRVDAVRGVDFEVKKGEIFGLLGPNGAGKTTTLKVVLGLVFPTRGAVELFGSSPPRRADMARVGYLPENPYVYQYLRAPEFLDLCGRLMGMSAAARASRSKELIERVGLAHAVDRPIGRFSKGMTQRIALAQALLHDPELLILDEPMSGLDPIGRKDVRDVILEQRRAGKTLIFTSHILSDVELLCDRVAILQRGKVTSYGALRELLRGDVARVEVELALVSDALRESLAALAASHARVGGHDVFVVDGEDAVPELLRAADRGGARVVAVTPHRETLEDLFVRQARAADDGTRAP